AGSYVKSYTKVKNFVLVNDVIEVIANHSMKIEVVDKKKTVVGELDAIKFYTKIKAIMSKEEIDKNLKKVMQDQSVVDDYNRLKAEFEKQNQEIEKLKKQLEAATDGEKKKIVKIISEEEKRYKANLWIERAQQISSLNTEGRLEAYQKALELNPDMPQAYLGIAKTLEDEYTTIPTSDKEREDKLEALREALETLNKAISLDENYAEAYALRAEILYKIESIENLEENKKDYDAKILEDIGRALVLNVTNKGELYNLRAFVYLNQLQNAELEQLKLNEFNAETIEEYLNKAINEIDNAGSFCREKEWGCLSEYYKRKAQAYSLVRNYYIRQGDLSNEKKYGLLINAFVQQAEALEKQESERWKEEEKNQEALFNNTEFGKIAYELNLRWREKIMGIKFQEREEKSEDEKEKIGKLTEAKIKKKISSGTASAEEYIFMSYIIDDSHTSKRYFEKGITLLEKKNPNGIDALLLVQFYLNKAIGDDEIALNYLSKAKGVVDRHINQVKKISNFSELLLLVPEMEKAKGDEGKLIFENKISKLNKKQSEFLYWINFALEISTRKAVIYEKLNLLEKAREEYHYLCETFKDDKSCKNATKLQ
ncbi:MAG: hypothetical protein NC828_06940, partial [Candidatus Omnitrophica bacterium]|nr:hypothetical protein [Candidatus Omnitrophota bacterium]